ncbi:MAG: ABC transporter ATP-binding protein/permease [Actinomycetota bacterium]|nr:ABC transporter ATP-binding protein/permease [Actinomycetota bacterium]
MTDALKSLALVVNLGRRAGAARSLTAVGAAVVSGVAAVLIGLWLKMILDGVARGDSEVVTFAAAVLGVTVTLQMATSSLSHLLLGELHMACGKELVCNLMRAGATPPGIEHLERPDYADRIALLKSETTYLSGFLPVIGETVGLVARVSVTGILLARVHPALLLLPALSIPSFYAGSRAERAVNAANEATAEQDRLNEHLFTLATTPGPGKELRIFGLEREIVARQRAAWQKVTTTVARAQLRAGLVRAAGWLPFAAGYLGAVGYALVKAERGDATPGDVLLVMILAGQVNGQVAQLLNLANRSAAGLRVLARYRWLLDYASAAVAAAAPTEPAPVPDRLHHGIDLCGVSFRYPGEERPEVLSGIDLHLPAGSTVAIVGENGAGKTSLVKLLCRLYEPTAGTITVDGVDIRRFDVGDWRRRLSGGFQDFARIELLLRQSVGVGDLGDEGVTGGRPSAVDDAPRLGRVLTQAAAALPIGLDGQLGAQWPGGVDLSEGQWQKVALARGLLRQDPLLLLLDEPTSGLDPAAEHAVFETFAIAAAGAARRSGAVVVLVSHRFSTVRMADHIIVLASGQVVEEGSHEELMSLGGLYADLFSVQARAYR